jgi:hypothetical protein
MRETQELTGFEQRLLVELRTVVSERALESTPKRSWRDLSLPPRSLRRWAILVPVAAAVLVAVLGGPTIVAPSDRGSSAYAVEVLGDGRIHVKVAADFDEGKRLERELRQAGVSIEVISVPSHPRLVGTIEFPQHQLAPKGIEAGHGEFWIDPARFTGTVEVLVNVAADPGEEWRQAPSVFHPDEPLGGLPCAISGALDTATLERYARGVGITKFSWWILEGDPKASRNVVRADKRPEGEVEHAELVAPSKLRVGVRPTSAIARYGHAAAPSMNLNVHESPQPGCTPELAARWPRS